ncbi:MAG: N-formylglutamate amidohydrolase [bacterium]|nr:N-formylglutamate amidohydrolase [bacterium]
MNLLLSCEHGGNQLPPEYAADLGPLTRDLLDSHRGWDPGALAVARQLSKALKRPLVFSETSRLLVDLNRSLGHRNLFGPEAKLWPQEKRHALLARYYHPYRQAFEQRVEEALAQGPLWHVAVHSFSPIWEGQPRRTQIGLLYDPQRDAEKELALSWQRDLQARFPDWSIRRNAPYRGQADGLTTYLRRRFGPAYRGFELELRQDLLALPEDRGRLAERLTASIRTVLG